MKSKIISTGLYICMLVIFSGLLIFTIKQNVYAVCPGSSALLCDVNPANDGIMDTMQTCCDKYGYDANGVWGKIGEEWACCSPNVVNPPSVNVPDCSNLTLSGSNGSSTLSLTRNISLGWGFTGDTPEAYLYAINGVWIQDWILSSNTNASLNTGQSGNINIRLKMRNSGGEGSECSANIIVDSPPEIVGAYLFDPAVNDPSTNNSPSPINWGGWSGTLTNDDNNTNVNSGSDYNSLGFVIDIKDPDGIADITALAMGMSRDPSSIDNYSSTWCNPSDPLEWSFMQHGIDPAFYFTNGVITDIKEGPCGSPPGRYKIGARRSFALSSDPSNTLRVIFTIEFDPDNNKGDKSPKIDQGMHGVWAKAKDKYNIWTGGVDVYNKIGTWGIDTVSPIKRGFEQKQPTNANTLRVIWDGDDVTSGFFSIQQLCERSGVTDCDPSWGLGTITNSSLLPLTSSYGIGSDDLKKYVFKQIVTDKAGNMREFSSQALNVGVSWMQIIWGDVYANNISISTPSEYAPPSAASLFNDPSILSPGFAQMKESTAFTNTPGVIELGQAKSVYRGASKNYSSIGSLLGEVFVPGDGLFDRLDSQRDALVVSSGNSIRILTGSPIPKDGIYKLRLNSDAELYDADFVSNGVRNVILLIEGNNTTTLNIRAPFDPQFNLIIIARGVEINFVNSKIDNLFSREFMSSPKRAEYCSGGRTCISGLDAGNLWLSNRNLNSLYDNDYTYMRYSDKNSDGDYEDLEDEVMVDPGVDRYSLYLISNRDVKIPAEETDTTYGSYTDPSWDGDFERVVFFGGILAPNISFDRNLVAKDNSWIPAETFIYNPNVIDAYVGITKGTSISKSAFGDWQEAGFEY